MSKPPILETLRGIQFFHDIADEYLEQLGKIVRIVEFPAHSEIFREHDVAKDVYVIIHGRVSLILCAPKVGCRQLMEVSDGEFVGWSPLIGRPRLSDTAHTLTRTTAVAIDGEQILALCANAPQFGFEFMRRAAMALSDRLSATRLQLLEMGGLQLPNVQIETD